jgi:hypothetical protein
MLGKIAVSNVLRDLESFCYDKPLLIVTDQESLIDSDEITDISALIVKLRQEGHLVAKACFGRNHFNYTKFKTDNLGNYSVFKMNPGSPYTDAPAEYVMILGAERLGQTANVFFIEVKKSELDRTCAFKEYTPIAESPDIYRVAFDVFKKHLVDLYSSSSFVKFVHQLIEMPLQGIAGQKKAECNNLGQEIFDTFKHINGGDSDAGRAALASVLSKIEHVSQDGEARCAEIKKAWRSVGDDNVFWV